MLNPISYPDRTCFLDKVPEIVMQADGCVTMTLCLMQMQQDLFIGRYQPGFDERIRIDISDIVKNRLKVKLPVDDSDLYQSEFKEDFVFKADVDDSGGDMSGEFAVVNASPDTNEEVETWCSGHFLTKQPVEKPTNYESPEWLTYYDYEGNWVLKCRFYPKTGGAVDAIVRQDEKPGCWSVNVNFARIIPLVSLLPWQLKGYYDLILFDGSQHELCRQRYLYEERTNKEHYYLFANSLGGIDTLIAQGENVLQPELEHNIGRFSKRYKPLDDTEDMRQWQQNTGVMPHRWRNWLYDLLANKQGAAKYDPVTGTYHSIVVKSTDIGMSDNGQLANATFDYIMDMPDTVIAEMDNSLSQSAADAAEALADLTTEAKVGIEAGASQPVAVNSEKVYVSFAESGSASAVHYYIDGVDSGSFTPGTNKSPVVIDLPFGASLHFETQGDTAGLTLNWYEGWHERFMFQWSSIVCIEAADTYSYSWSEQECIQVDEPYSFAWSEDRCVQQSGGYEFYWKEDRCVQQAGGYEFYWKEDRCVQEYIYRLAWEDIDPDPDESIQS